MYIQAKMQSVSTVAGHRRGLAMVPSSATMRGFTSWPAAERGLNKMINSKLRSSEDRGILEFTCRFDHSITVAFRVVPVCRQPIVRWSSSSRCAAEAQSPLRPVSGQSECASYVPANDRPSP